MNHGTPIDEAAKELRLTEDDRATIRSLSHVRTVGDLEAAIERGELPKALAAKVRKALG